VKKDDYDRYFIHDILKQFFYRGVLPSKRKEHHLIAAQWHENREESIDLIEAIYHYLQGGEYKKASEVAIDRSLSILEGGYCSEFLAILERLNEREIGTNIWVEILIIKSNACNMCGEWKKALLYFTQSADIAFMIGDKKLQMKSIYESGLILEEQNRFDEAMDCFNNFVLGVSRS